MKTGQVVGISLNEERGVSKKHVGQGYLKKDFGLVGDGHGGSEIKQVSLLSIESINKKCKPLDIEAGPGDFAENITTEGLNLLSLPVGTILQAGDALLEVSQHGKKLDASHTFNFKGLCILPYEGIFCRILESGNVKDGDKITVIKEG